jgi:O-antigen/teichoic acid export membrane protein
MIFRLSLRAIGLVAKFILTLAITHYLGYSELGIYGVVIAASLIASKFFSVGFSSEINRLISVQASTKKLINRILRVYLIAGISISAITTLVYISLQEESFSASLIACAMLVLLTEHISFEINSFIYSAHRANLGASLFFIKTGLWAILSTIGLYTKIIESLEPILWLWIISNALVITIGYFSLITAHKNSEEPQIINTLSVWQAGIPFYFGAILLATSQYIERFIILSFETYERLGTYIYAWSIANTLQTVSYAVIAVIALPRIAKKFNNSTVQISINDLFINKWIISSIGLCAITALTIHITLNYGLDFFNVQISKPDGPILSILTLSFALRAIGDLVWGALIATKNRKISVISSAACVLISLPIYYVLIEQYSLYGAAWGNVLSVAIQLSTIAVLLKYNTPRAQRCHA